MSVSCRWIDAPGTCSLFRGGSAEKKCRFVIEKYVNADPVMGSFFLTHNNEKGVKT